MWRRWLYSTLVNDAAVTEIVPADRWYASANFEQTPTPPFGVYKILNESREVGPATSVPVEIWVYDYEGSYVTIDDALKRIRDAVLAAAVPEGGISAVWIGDGEDLQDPEMGTVFRTASFQLYGRTA